MFFSFLFSAFNFGSVSCLSPTCLSSVLRLMMSSVAADGRCGFMFIMALTPPCRAARLEADLSRVFVFLCVWFFVSLSCVECALNVYYVLDTCLPTNVLVCLLCVFYAIGALLMFNLIYIIFCLSWPCPWHPLPLCVLPV